jgi:hypothetical protein
MALDKSTSSSLFGNIKKEAEKVQPIPQEVEEQGSEPIAQTTSPAIPSAKWQSFDKVTALLSEEQKEGLDRVARQIMRFRSQKLKGVDNKERITANTLIRALIENFLEVESSLPMETLSSESEVYEWVSKHFKSRS